MTVQKPHCEQFENYFLPTVHLHAGKTVNMWAIMGKCVSVLAKDTFACSKVPTVTLKNDTPNARHFEMEVSFIYLSHSILL